MGENIGMISQKLYMLFYISSRTKRGKYGNTRIAFSYSTNIYATPTVSQILF